MVKLACWCEDCLKLIQTYGEDNLDICDRCGHYYHGEKCMCEMEPNV